MAGRVHKAAHCPSAPTLSSGRYTVGAAVAWCGEGFDGQNILFGIWRRINLRTLGEGLVAVT